MTNRIGLNRIFRKCIVLILDGLGDLPVTALMGKTPLEAADTPVLNRLAGLGTYGLVDPETRGKTPNTHTGCGALLGVPPSVLSGLKRGPVEAFGAGYNLQPGDIAIRANFATLERENGGYRVVDRRAGRISEGTQELSSAVNAVTLGDGISGKLIPTDQHRCVLVFSGPGLDPHVSDTDPGDRGMPGLVRICSPKNAAAQLTAQKINLFIAKSFELLSGHPVNQARIESGMPPATGVITRSAGVALTLENMVRDRGISAALVAGCNTVTGLARALGFEVIRKKEFTADAETDLPGKMDAALQALERHDLVYVHVKATDLFAHDRDAVGKKEFLERIDMALEVLEKSGAVIALSADHSTNSNTGAHTSDPVPALIYDPSARDGTKGTEVKFGESACSKGLMARQEGHEFLVRLLDLIQAS